MFCKLFNIKLYWGCWTISILDHTIFSLLYPEEAVMGRQIWSMKNECEWSKCGLLFISRNCWLKIFCCQKICKSLWNRPREECDKVCCRCICCKAFVLQACFAANICRWWVQRVSQCTFFLPKKKAEDWPLQKVPWPHRDLTICNLIAYLEPRNNSRVWRLRWGFSSQFLFPVKCSTLSSLKVTEMFLFSSIDFWIRL